jgi:hypothetical protein
MITAQRRSRATLSLTLALDGGGWSTPHPCRFTPGNETWYPLYSRLGGPQGWSVWVQKILPSPGFVLQTIQPIVSRCADYAILARTHL